MGGVNMRMKVGVALGAAAVLVMAGCAEERTSWEWSPAEDGTPVANVDYYFDYPHDDEFAVGAITALVRITDLRHNVAVPASEGAERWVYTPATVRIVGAGNSGLQVGDELVIAIPGGTADGVSSPSLWDFDKAELDSTSLYLVSWTPYDYPGFTLPLVMQYIYEESSAGFTRLQSEPGAVEISLHEPTFTVAEVASDMMASDARLGALSRQVAQLAAPTD